jgi:hypothetical protein
MNTAYQLPFLKHKNTKCTGHIHKVTNEKGKLAFYKKNKKTL